MSAAMASDTRGEDVYVRLLDEGTTVFRRVTARWLSADVAELIAPASGYDPDDEHWEFLPGSIVRVEKRQIDGIEVNVAVRFRDGV